MCIPNAREGLVTSKCGFVHTFAIWRVDSSRSLRIPDSSCARLCWLASEARRLAAGGRPSPEPEGLWWRVAGGVPRSSTGSSLAAAERWRGGGVSCCSVGSWCVCTKLCSAALVADSWMSLSESCWGIRLHRTRKQKPRTGQQTGTCAEIAEKE